MFRADRVRSGAVLMNMGLGVRSVGASREGAVDIKGAAGVGVGVAISSGDFGLVTPDADTAEVSGRLGPLRENVFQSHDGVNLVAAPFKSGRATLELRELPPTSVDEPAGESVDKAERAERADRMEDCEGEELKSPDFPVGRKCPEGPAASEERSSLESSAAALRGLSSIGAIREDVDASVAVVRTDMERFRTSVPDRKEPIDEVREFLVLLLCSFTFSVRVSENMSISNLSASALLINSCLRE